MAGFLDSLSNIQWTDNRPATGGITPYENLGALGRFGLTLQNIADPTAITNYQENVTKDELRRNELTKQSALQALASDPNFANLSPAEQLRQTAAITGDPSALAQYNVSREITPYQQAQLGLEQQRIGAAANNANKVQFVTGADGAIYAADPRTGALSALTKGLKAPTTTGLPEGFQWGADQSGNPAAVPIPGVQTKEEREKQAAAKVKADSAVSFLQKIGDFDNALSGLGDSGGTIEGSQAYRKTVGAINPFGGNESKRQLFDQLVASSELDIAQQQLKGQGSVTDTERQIARNKLPSVTDVNTSTSRSKLVQLAEESIRNVDAVNPQLAQELRQQYAPVLNYKAGKSSSDGWKATVIK